MSKLVAHVTSSGTQGQHVVKDYLQDVNTTDDTKAWLHEMTGGSVQQKDSNKTEAAKRKSGGEPGWVVSGRNGKQMYELINIYQKLFSLVAIFW